MSDLAPFLDELRARLPLSDVAGRKVVWDRRKSVPAKGDWWAPCPFHQEKTPSFHVDDTKGFYYCFGCHQKGDLISFVTETENLSFIEAVEFLAGLAGMEMPARNRSPEAKAARDRNARLFDAMEEAVKLFGLAFRSAAGEEARAYAQSRGLSDTTLKRFEIGFAPDSRTHLVEAFKSKGTLKDAVEAGLVIEPDGGGTPFDRFRGRLMFPIRDPRGRCIAFGGRAMSAEQQAKYLNSPETPLFHKGRTIYNHALAREAAAKAGTLIVAEGYMDVIALDAGGFSHAVAPLGTAITEDQLRLFWRMADEPVIALDGDTAGLRAADRLVDLALPLLEPGKSLRFCVLPEGQDPDDLLKTGGRAAMSQALDAARPLVEQLWLKETTAGPVDTPERRAAFDKRLREALNRIGDASVRRHYADEIARRRSEFLAPPKKTSNDRPWRSDQSRARGKGRSGGRFGPPPGPAAQTRNTGRVRSGDPRRIREATILMIALRNPDAIGPVEGGIETMGVATPELARIRDGLIRELVDGAEGLAARLAARLGDDPVEILARIPEARDNPLAKPGRDPSHVVAVLEEALALHAAELAWATEQTEARRDLAAAEGEDWTWRIRQADAERRAAAGRSSEDNPDAAAPQVSDLQRMLDQQIYRKPKG